VQCLFIGARLRSFGKEVTVVAVMQYEQHSNRETLRPKTELGVWCAALQPSSGVALARDSAVATKVKPSANRSASQTSVADEFQGGSEAFERCNGQLAGSGQPNLAKHVFGT